MVKIYKIFILLLVCSCTSQQVKQSFNEQVQDDVILKDVLVRGRVFSSNHALENVEVLQVTFNQLHPTYHNTYDCIALDSYVKNLSLVKDWNINIDSVNIFSVINTVKSNSKGNYDMLVEKNVMKYTTFFKAKDNHFYAFIFFVFRKEGYKSEVIPFAPECEYYNFQNVELKARK